MLIIFSRLCVSWQSCVNVLRIMYQQVGGETVALMCFTNHFATGTTHNEWKKGLGLSHVSLEEVIVMSASRRYTITCGAIAWGLMAIFLFLFPHFPFLYHKLDKVQYVKYQECARGKTSSAYGSSVCNGVKDMSHVMLK